MNREDNDDGLREEGRWQISGVDVWEQVTQYMDTCWVLQQISGLWVQFHPPDLLTGVARKQHQPLGALSYFLGLFIWKSLPLPPFCLQRSTAVLAARPHHRVKMSCKMNFILFYPIFLNIFYQLKLFLLYLFTDSLYPFIFFMTVMTTSNSETKCKQQKLTGNCQLSSLIMHSQKLPAVISKYLK